jgi:hypothetical protein
MQASAALPNTECKRGDRAAIRAGDASGSAHIGFVVRWVAAGALLVDLCGSTAQGAFLAKLLRTNPKKFQWKHFTLRRSNPGLHNSVRTSGY